YDVDYDVDGYDEVLLESFEENQRQNENVGEVNSCKQTAKELRNKGETYVSTKSKRKITGRKYLPFDKCTVEVCQRRKLACRQINDDKRKELRESFYNLGNLEQQRQWISSHVTCTPLQKSGRKKKRLEYFLPSPNRPGQKVKVCRKMFLATLALNDRQVRTVLQKAQNMTGVLEGERRGGKRRDYKEKHDKVKAHLGRFPRVPSHYCRAHTSCTYVSPDLTKVKMYKLFVKEHGRIVSLSFYKSIMRDMHIKIHKPKKDLCGLCSNFHNAEGEQKQLLKEKFDAHRGEIEKVRNVKSTSKERALTTDNHSCGVFDLQQVLYLPKSNRNELFYRRRLACYNLTIYDMSTRDGICYLSNETLTKRGSNEIASYVLDYLRLQDANGKQTVDLFCDGCCGQNKNSVLPSMALCFLAQSKCVDTVTFHFFETCHGQSECDSIHSHVEQHVNRSVEVMHPAHLASLIKHSRSNPAPYVVKCVETKDILDWKGKSQRQGLLRTRTSDEGVSVDWTAFKQVQVRKKCPDKIFFKMSHLDDAFLTLSFGQSRRPRPVEDPGKVPGQAYETRPRLSAAKYQDLVSLCHGPTPVVNQPDLVEFYENLPHC
ncbi:uncharacterized protein, partial [Diadema setosum]|uniref:uncharacterized protein n=1 Tax=Diadema setosum TaxID=31175 RepID=UPI003B3B603E